MKYLQFFLSLTLLVLGSTGEDFCNSNLCPQGTTHIACDNLGVFGPRCPPSARVVNIVPQKDLIVGMVNVRRNKVAKGEQPGFAEASRMGLVTWSNTLAGLAKNKVMDCLAQHDECRNTEDFSQVAQLVHLQRSRQNINLRTFIIEMIQKWFQRYRFANAAKMAAFERAAEDYSAYAILVNDRVQYIGCACSSFKINGILNVLFVCNFSSRNNVGSYVYQAGPTASACTTGTDATYDGLCTAAEFIDPNAP